MTESIAKKKARLAKKAKLDKEKKIFEKRDDFLDKSSAEPISERTPREESGQASDQLPEEGKGIKAVVARDSTLETVGDYVIKTIEEPPIKPVEKDSDFVKMRVEEYVVPPAEMPTENKEPPVADPRRNYREMDGASKHESVTLRHYEWQEIMDILEGSASVAISVKRIEAQID